MGWQKDSSYGLLHYDYGFRIYHPGLGRFLSVDPLAKDYPSWTPYAFAMNRVIDGVDLDGLEWAYSTIEMNPGEPQIKISVNVSLDLEDGVTEILGIDLDLYKQAVSDKFNQVLRNTAPNLSGEVTFDPVTVSGQVVPVVGLYAEKYYLDDPDNQLVSTGNTTANITRNNIFSKKDELKSPEDLASLIVHELLHTARIEHPFEYTQAADSKLILIGPNSLISNDETDENIIYNIMLYDINTIDGVNRGELLKKEGYSKEKLTLGLVDFLLKQIDLMMKGEGSNGVSDPFYWDSVGERVEKK